MLRCDAMDDLSCCQPRLGHGPFETSERDTITWTLSMPPLTLPRASNRSTDQLPTVSSFQFHVGNEDKKVVPWTVEEEEEEEEPSIPGLVDRLFRFDWLTGRTDGAIALISSWYWRVRRRRRWWSGEDTKHKTSVLCKCPSRNPLYRVASRVE